MRIVPGEGRPPAPSRAFIGIMEVGAGSVIKFMAAIEPAVLKAVAVFRMPLFTLGLAGLRCSWRCVLRG